MTDRDRAKQLAPDGATHYFRRYSLDGKDDGFDFYKKDGEGWNVYLGFGEWFFLEFGTWDNDESPIRSLL